MLSLHADASLPPLHADASLPFLELALLELPPMDAPSPAAPLTGHGIDVGDPQEHEFVDWDTLQIVDQLDEEGRPQIASEEQLYVALGLAKEDETRKQGTQQASKSRLYEEDENMVISQTLPEQMKLYDRNNPVMELGSLYPSMKEFRIAMRQYAIDKEFELGLEATDPTRYRGFCKGGDCPWMINAIPVHKGWDIIKVTVLTDVHTCTSSGRRSTSTPTSSWVASVALPILRLDPDISATKLQKKLQDQSNCTIKYHTVWRGKEKAMAELYGTWEQNFKLLFNWRAAILEKSPNSVVEIACGVDDVCTDACKGLENAVQAVFPQAEKRECFRHLIQNYIRKYPGSEHMYPAAWAYRKVVYEHHMAIVRSDPLIAKYLDKDHKLLWYRSGFNPNIKCDYVTNNIAEVFNNWVKDIKDLPVCELADKIREKIMDLFYRRRRIGQKLHGRILPEVIRVLKARTRGLGHLSLVKGDDYIAEVRDNGDCHSRHVVKARAMECECEEWQHTGQPCQHGLCLIIAQPFRDVRMEDFVHGYFSVDKFRKAYKGLVPSLGDKSYWPKVDIRDAVSAPLAKRPLGRQRKNRIKGCLEGGSGKKSTGKEKIKQMVRGPYKCANCGELGHCKNSPKCPHNGTQKKEEEAKEVVPIYNCCGGGASCGAGATCGGASGGTNHASSKPTVYTY